MLYPQVYNHALFGKWNQVGDQPEADLTSIMSQD
jgi:hypothetical protein